MLSCLSGTVETLQTIGTFGRERLRPGAEAVGSVHEGEPLAWVPKDARHLPTAIWCDSVGSTKERAPCVPGYEFPIYDCGPGTRGAAATGHARRTDGRGNETVSKWDTKVLTQKRRGASEANANHEWFVPKSLARGAAGELLACVDLMRHGFEVFKNVNPTGSCDLAVEIGGEFMRVEVKIGTLDANGKPLVETARQLGKFDLLAVVGPDGSVSYFDPGMERVKFVKSLCPGSVGVTRKINPENEPVNPDQITEVQ